MRVPIVELSDCILCDVCVEVCPTVFRHNAADYIEVVELDQYPQTEVDEAIKDCPANCIGWSEE